MAYTQPLLLSRTKRTSPNAPRPMMVRGSKSSAVNLARLRRVNSRSRRSSSDRSSSFVSAGIEDARASCSTAARRSTRRRNASAWFLYRFSMYAFAASTFFFVSGVGGVVLGHPGGRTPALAAEDDAEAFNGLLPVMRPSQLVPPGLLIAGDPFGSEGRDPESGDCSLRTSILFELREHLTDCPASREAEGCRARQEMRIARTAKLGARLSPPPNFRARDATTMNADLVAAQLEEFRAALAEVNANVRLLPLSPRSSLPRASLADPLVAPENDSSTPRPRLFERAKASHDAERADFTATHTRAVRDAARVVDEKWATARAENLAGYADVTGSLEQTKEALQGVARANASAVLERDEEVDAFRETFRAFQTERRARDSRLRESRGVARERDAGFPGGRAGGQAGRGCALLERIDEAHRAARPARRVAFRSALGALAVDIDRARGGWRRIRRVQGARGGVGQEARHRAQGQPGGEAAACPKRGRRGSGAVRGRARRLMIPVLMSRRYMYGIVHFG